MDHARCCAFTSSATLMRSTETVCRLCTVLLYLSGLHSVLFSSQGGHTSVSTTDQQSTTVFRRIFVSRSVLAKVFGQILMGLILPQRHRSPSTVKKNVHVRSSSHLSAPTIQQMVGANRGTEDRWALLVGPSTRDILVSGTNLIRRWLWDRFGWSRYSPVATIHGFR